MTLTIIYSSNMCFFTLVNDSKMIIKIQMNESVNECGLRQAIVKTDFYWILLDFFISRCNKNCLDSWNNSAIIGLTNFNGLQIRFGDWQWPTPNLKFDAYVTKRYHFFWEWPYVTCDTKPHSTAWLFREIWYQNTWKIE